MRPWVFCLLLLHCSSVSQAQGWRGISVLGPDEPEKAASGDAQAPRPQLPVDAISMIHADIVANPLDAPFRRYIWVANATELSIGAVKTTVNSVLSRSGTVIDAIPIGDGSVLCWDFRRLANGNLATLDYLLGVWERMAQFEPYFLQNGPEVVLVPVKQIAVVTAAKANVASGDRVLGQAKVGSRFEIIDTVVQGKFTWLRVEFNGEAGFLLRSQVRIEDVKQTDVIQARTFAPHCGTEANDIAIACRSNVPVVRWDWFNRVAWSNLDRGLYYEFRGIEPAPSGSTLTDYEHFLTVFAGVTEADLDLIRARLSEPRNKTVIFESEVTKKPRSVIVFRSPAGPVTTNQGLVAVTQDMANDDVDPAADAVRNLKKHKFAAMEVFIELANGMLVYGLFAGDFNGDGKFDRNVTKVVKGVTIREGELQRAAPDDVVSDHTVPDGYTKNLQAGISCVRCHVGRHKETGLLAEGWMPLKNDAQTLFESGLDVYGERDSGIPLYEDIELLSSQYQGDLDKPLTRARDDLAEALVRLTRIRDNKEGHSVTTQVHGEVARAYNEYWYTSVTPEEAAYELGFVTRDRKSAVRLLRHLWPRLPADETQRSPEDVILGGLKANLNVTRLQWELVYADAALRALKALEGEPENEEHDADAGDDGQPVFGEPGDADVGQLRPDRHHRHNGCQWLCLEQWLLDKKWAELYADRAVSCAA